MSLTKNLVRKTRDHNTRHRVPLNVADTIEIFVGALLFIDAVSGLAVLTSNAGANQAAGFAHRYFLNDTGATTTNFPVQAEFGHVEEIDFSGSDVDRVGQNIFGTEEDVFTLTSAGSSFFGSIVDQSTDKFKVLVKQTIV